MYQQENNLSNLNATRSKTREFLLTAVAVKLPLCVRTDIRIPVAVGVVGSVAVDSHPAGPVDSHPAGLVGTLHTGTVVG